MSRLIAYLTSNPAGISKAITAFVAALVAVGVALEDGTITPQEWITIAVAAATAAGVYLVPNDDRLSE